MFQKLCADGNWHFNPSPTRIYPTFANSVDPLKKPTDLDLHYLSFKYMNLYQQSGQSNLNCWN